jgi:hypothetical protein
MTDRTPRRPAGKWRSAKWSTIHSLRPGGEVIRKREAAGRVAWKLAVRARETAEARIVHAFRQQLEAGGSGPAEADLLLFAQAAIAEQRTARALAKTRPMFASRRR